MNGINFITNESVSPDQILVALPWAHEVRIVANVPVRMRGTYEKDGKTYQRFSPLTEDELRQFAMIKNLSRNI